MTVAAGSSALPSDSSKQPTEVVVPIPGSPEHDAAMAAKFDAAQGAAAPVDPPAPATRPDHIPEKFWDATTGTVKTEELVKSYAELEKSKSKGQDDQTTVTPPANPDEAADALASRGLEMSKFSEEFAVNGGLSPESYKALETAGISQEMVNAYIAGQEAIAEKRDNIGYELAGGKDAFAKIAAWSTQSLTKPELVAFNKAVGGTEEEMKLAVLGLRARYETANGKNPTLLGGSGINGGTIGYESKAQMTADMRDPRYAKDPAYRAKVEAKLVATTAF